MPDKEKTFSVAGYQKLWGFLLGWLHQELFPPKAYVPQTKFSPKKGIFGTKTLFFALSGPFQALFGPFFTLFNEKASAIIGTLSGNSPNISSNSVFKWKYSLL